MKQDQYEYTVTVLTPTYNRASYLEKLWDSLCKQTNKDFQWLIIDDGSMDDTQDIVAKFKTQEFLVEYHKKENGGKHTALNYAHPFIRGELVIIVDSDDYLDLNVVECLVNKAQSEGADVVVYNMKYIGNRFKPCL